MKKEAQQLLGMTLCVGAVLYFGNKHKMQEQIPPGDHSSPDEFHQVVDPEKMPAEYLDVPESPWKKPQAEAESNSKKPAKEKKKKTVFKPKTKEERYIQRFYGVAVMEMKKFGVPASIKLAQGLIETGAGQSLMAKRENNHFGIKCKRKCDCRCAVYADDRPNDRFRVYDSAWQSYRHHSELLTTGRYRHLLRHGKNYRAWAKGLKRAGYATNPRYAEMLIATIEKHRLYRYDAL